VKRARLVLLAALATPGACAKGIPLPEATPTVLVPAGTFIIGGGPVACPVQTGNCGSTTGARPVVLSQSYGIEAHEVTIRQYQACVELGYCCGDASDGNYADHGDQPAQVRIEQARQYCRYHGRWLPTEAEWEVAARVKDASGVTQVYPWGDSPLSCGQIPSQDCHAGDSEIPAVGSNPLDKTPLGIYDMAGSVAEWVEDDYVAGIGCRFQTLLGSLCSGDSTCAANMCGGAATCQVECQGPGAGNTCGGTLANGGDPCPTVPAGEALQDPFFVTYDHSTQGTGPGCQYNSNQSSGVAMSKGGGVWEPSCAQNPAMRTAQQNFGSVSSGSGGRQLGFRCVQRDGVSTGFPRPTGTARLMLSAQPTCGVIEVASPTPDAPIAGWGTQTRVALASQLGYALARYDGTLKRYLIDLNDRQAFPNTPCPVSNFQPMFNGGAYLILSAVPVGGFDVAIRYPGQGGTIGCTVSYTQTVNLLSYQNTCSAMGPPGGATCQ
jgi:formylglycine-generating enzyme required for sulfatase activity